MNFLSILIISIALLPTAVMAKDSIKMQAGWLLNGEFAAFCSALVTGIYDNHGLNVELSPGGPVGGGFVVATTALAQDRSIDIAIDGDVVPLIRGAARVEADRLNVRAFASFWRETPFGFLVRANSGIRSLQDLAKGRADGGSYRIGVTSDFVLQKPLAQMGNKNPEDLNFVTVGFDALPLISGVVDAQAGYWITQAYELVKAGINYEFLPISQIPGFRQPSLVALAREETLATKPDILARWLRASREGAYYVIAHPNDAAQHILDKRCGGPAFDLSQEAWLINQSIPLYNAKSISALNPTDLVTFSRQLHSIGEILFVPNIEAIYTNQIELLSRQ